MIYNGEYICSVVHKIKKEYGSSDPFQICKLKKNRQRVKSPPQSPWGLLIVIVEEKGTVG